MNAVDARTLEALVDGELGEAERADLLRSLDTSPDGWRKLGLAFLADQALRQSFAVPAQGRMLSRQSPAPPASLVLEGPRKHGTAVSSSSRKSSLRPWLVGVAACAACALIAFGLGVWGVPPREVVVQPPPPLLSELAKANVVEPHPPEVPPMPTLTAAARKELERLGFTVHERPRVVPVQHQDGRTIKVLVNEIEVRYVGRPSVL